MESKKKYRLAIGILLLGLTISTALAYTLYVNRPVSFFAHIKTVIAFNIFSQPECLPGQEFTTYDFGEYGAEGKTILFYLKNEGNDKVYIQYNLTEGIGWHYQGEGWYTDGKFKFKVDLPAGACLYPNVDPNPSRVEVGAHEIVEGMFQCLTEEYLPYMTSWSITLYGYGA